MADSNIFLSQPFYINALQSGHKVWLFLSEMMFYNMLPWNQVIAMTARQWKSVLMGSSNCRELVEKDDYLSSIYFPQWRLDGLNSFLEDQQSSDLNVTYQYELNSGSLRIDRIDNSKNKNVSILKNENYRFEWNKEFLKNFMDWSSSRLKG